MMDEILWWVSSYREVGASAQEYFEGIFRRKERAIEVAQAVANRTGIPCWVKGAVLDEWIEEDRPWPDETKIAVYPMASVQAGERTVFPATEFAL